MIPFVKFFESCYEEEDYPSAFSFSEFNNIPSYAGKLKYAASHLTRLGSGSARTVFQVDDAKVIKIAKNVKGLGQNNTEADWSLQQYGIVARVFEIGDTIKDEGPFWLEMELARKVSPKRFAQLTGVSLEDVWKYLQWWKHDNGPKRGLSIALEPELKQRMEDSEWFQDLFSVINDYDMESPGDFGRTSTYGEVLRDGVPSVVLIDFGLSKGVYYDYYAK